MVTQNKEEFNAETQNNTQREATAEIAETKAKKTNTDNIDLT